jgi:hypothetical protein
MLPPKNNMTLSLSQNPAGFEKGFGKAFKSPLFPAQSSVAVPKPGFWNSNFFNV